MEPTNHIVAAKTIYVGFISSLFTNKSSYNKDINFICFKKEICGFYDEKKKLINSGTKTYVPKIYVQFIHNKEEFYIEIELQNIYKMRRDKKYSNVIEIFLSTPFNTLDKDMESYTKNKFIDFNDELLRYWVLKPVIRFENFQNFDHLYKILNNQIRDKKMKLPKYANKDKNTIKTNYSNKCFRPYQIVDYITNLKELKNYQTYVCSQLKKVNDEDLLYEIFMLVSSGKLRKPIDLDDKFLNFILENQNKNKNKLINSIRCITYSYKVKYKYHNNIFEAIKLAYSNYNSISRQTYGSSISFNLFRIKKIIITANLILFKEESPEQGNRMLNSFKDKANNFIRLSFTNDKLEKYNYLMNKSQLVVDDHIRVFLKNGLKILNGLYEFFCYSASQLRDYSVWMVKLEKDFNPFAIFDKIGNYYKEKNISKYASRRGLICTTAIFVGVVENIKILDDIYALEDFNDGIETKKKEELNFTDGCGTISVDLAKLAAKRFNLEFASAFQVRIGAAKGVLVVDPNLPENTVGLRKSMIKFEAKDCLENKELYIIRTSNYSDGFLNRQIIALLSFLGIDDKVFNNILDSNIYDIKKYDFFEKNYTKVNSFIKELEAKKVFRDKSFKNNPLIHGFDETFYMNSIESIKNKAKLLDTQTAKFIGVNDNSKLLKENQIYCCYQKGDQKKHVVTGKVIVTRSPCLYPGDIQILEAVDLSKELGHLFNIVVFPTIGKRPLQQLMSGGDLDGDIYMISWNKDLIPKKQENKSLDSMVKGQNFESTCIIKSKKVNENKEVKNDDIIEFICNYLKNDILGTICNRHLAFSDCSKNSFMSRECLDLAYFQTISVDFAKHGQNIEFKSLDNYKIDKWPHYFEKKPNRTIKSTKILGQIYDKVKELYEEALTKISNEMNINYTFNIPYRNGIGNGFEIFLESSNNIYNHYYDYLQRIFEKYKINTEFEFLSGVLLKFDRNKFGGTDFDISQTLKMELDKMRLYFESIYKMHLYHYLKYIDEYGIKFDSAFSVFILFNYNDIMTLNKKIFDEYYEEDEEFQIKEMKDKYEEIVKQFKNKTNGTELIENFRKGFITALSYLSHINYLNDKNINAKIINKKIYAKFNNDHPEYDINYYINSNYYDYYNFEYDRSNYYYDEDFDNDDYCFDNDVYVDNLPKNFKNFYSLPWILDLEIYLKVNQNI